MNNYDEKILIIKENQKKLLDMVKTKISDESIVFNLNTRNIVDVLKRDNTNIKKYEAVVSAQKLIEKYTNDIKNATSVVEIKEIRKNLNSCINKIKKEMKNRGFDDIEINNYNELVNKYRKRISQNIRFVKREEKINEIETLNNNFDNLNEEELLRLKKLVKNEVSYGKRNIDNIDSIFVKKQPKEVLFEEKNDKDLIGRKILREIKNNQSEPVKRINCINNIPDAMAVSNIKLYSNVYDYLSDVVVEFDKRYSVIETENYNGNIASNIFKLVRNTPKMVKNKKKAHIMIRDYNAFYPKGELYGYSRYILNKNSFSHNVKEVFKGSILKSKEEEYLDEHNKCVEWIIDFCKENNIRIKYAKRILSKQHVMEN